MRLAGTAEPTAILDLPSGHGRVLRFLSAAFPAAAVTASDIKRDAVDYCVEVFGARGVYSDTDFSKVRMDTAFDLVWVGSLFTHLDEQSWRDLLSFLTAHLKVDGLIVFTTIGCVTAEKLRGMGMWDDQIEEMLADFSGRGFGHQQYRGDAQWGLTVCSDRFVREAVDQQQGLQMLSYEPEAWGRQDVVACKLTA
jgi:cyclopropane fatty-acyl-phospholipid synthase-like methyltransferase